MCPNNDEWLKKKFSDASDIIPADVRVGLLKHAVQGTEIIINDWELKQPTYQTGEAFKHYFESLHPGATFIRIVGDDYGKCSPAPCFEYINNSWQIRIPRIDGISSTKIRQMIKRNEELGDISTPKVSNYMKSKTKNA